MVWMDEPRDCDRLAGRQTNADYARSDKLKACDCRFERDFRWRMFITDNHDSLPLRKARTQKLEAVTD